MHDRCYSGGSFLRPPRCRFRHREKHQPFITIGETSSRVVVIFSPAAWVTYGMRHWEWWQDKKPPDPHRPVVNLITIVDAVGGLQGLCLGDDEAVFVFLVRICGERYKKRGHLWLPEQVRAFLQDDALVKCGKGIEESLLRIHEDLPITDAGALVAKHVAPEVSVDTKSAMLSWDNFNEVRPSQYYFLQLLLTLSDTMKPRYKGSLQTTNDVRADQPSDAADATSPILTSHIADKDTIIHYIDTCATWLSDLRVKWDAWVKNLNATGPRQVGHVPIVGIDSEWTATKPLCASSNR